jgi:hypothetical protein
MAQKRTPSHVRAVLRQTDWSLLAEQKAVLASWGPIDDATRSGLLNWIDAIQDAAERDGHPVVYLETNGNV